jgi:very-short-patch-repair endonuclease
VDGRIHQYQKDKDKRRDQILKSLGYKVIRIKNEELKDIENVLNNIARSFS